MGSHAILSMVPVESADIDTMAVDAHFRLYHNPARFPDRSLDEWAGIVLHEVSHLLLTHHRRVNRMLGRDASAAEFELWNRAADYAANWLLRREGIPLPGLLDAEQDGFPGGLSAEEYFRLLRQQQRSVGGQCHPGGSCSDGRQRSWELPGPEESDVPGMKPHEQDMIVRETAQRISDKQAGTGSGAWDRWAKSVLTPRVDPRLAFLRHVRAAVESTSGQGDYSYRRPNRRGERRDVVLPSPVQPIPRITVIVDTSGSMDERDLGLSLGLIGKVLNTFRVRDGIRVVCGDTKQVHAARVFDPRNVRLAGGGGTDLGRVVREVAAQKPRPQLIVVCTDGGTPWCEPVGVPVVVCLTCESYVSLVPQWMKTVSLS
jgi:predicted metal-dependent peptidase